MVSYASRLFEEFHVMRSICPHILNLALRCPLRIVYAHGQHCSSSIQKRKLIPIMSRSVTWSEVSSLASIGVLLLGENIISGTEAWACSDKNNTKNYLRIERQLQRKTDCVRSNQMRPFSRRRCHIPWAYILLLSESPDRFCFLSQGQIWR